MTYTGAGLVAVLGWGIEDFEHACRESSDAALEGAREILSEEDAAEPAWMTERGRYGVKFIDELLQERRRRG